MEESNSQLERIFDTICQRHQLAVTVEDQEKTAYGPLFFLELQNQGNHTRLLYVDRVAAADFYDYENLKYLSYSVLSVYLQGQGSFLQTQDSEISEKLSDDLAPKDQADRVVSLIHLDDFSEVEEFLDTHMENY